MTLFSSGGGHSLRWGAALIALSAWAGTFLHLQLMIDRTHGDVMAAIWHQADFFSETTNLYAAIVFSLAALRVIHIVDRRLLGGIALAEFLVMSLYWTLLYARSPPPPEGVLSNLMVHLITPLSVCIYIVAAARPGRTLWTDPFSWAIYPLCYLIYAEVRGALDGHYPYYFIDAGKLGIAGVVAVTLAISIGFLAAGLAVTAFDRRGRSRASALAR